MLQAPPPVPRLLRLAHSGQDTNIRPTHTHRQKVDMSIRSFIIIHATRFTKNA
jgi:hypothetical protein